MVRANWADARAYAMNEGRALPLLRDFGKATSCRPGQPGVLGWRGPTRGRLKTSATLVEDSPPRRVRFSTPDTYQSASIDQSGDSSLLRLGGPRFVVKHRDFPAGWNDQEDVESCSPAPGRDRWM